MICSKVKLCFVSLKYGESPSFNKAIAICNRFSSSWRHWVLANSQLIVAEIDSAIGILNTTQG